MSSSSFSPGDAELPDLDSVLAPFVEVQRNQLHAWMRFQESLATLYKDLWEQWAVRFAGGAPIDR